MRTDSVTLSALALSTFLVTLPRADYAQSSTSPLSVLRIKIVLVDAEGPRPVPRHLLLISDNPATAAPRAVTTALDGTATVKLRPGSYTVESDRPVTLNGKTYQWTQTLDILAGQDASLELTVENAEIGSPGAAGATPGVSLESDPSVLIPKWQDSVVRLWTPFTRASGFVIDSRGLVVTSRRAIGAASAVEVQLTPTTKVRGLVLAADPVHDAAVLWINPKALGSIRSIPLPCTQSAGPTFAVGQEIFAIAVLPRLEKDVTSGKISRLAPGAVLSDLALDAGGAGGPVFSTGGVAVGIASVADEEHGSEVPIVRSADACVVVAAAEKKMAGAEPPSEQLLPVEPARALAPGALEDAAKGRAGSLKPYQISSSAFEVAFITPVLAVGGRQGSTLLDFGNWASYVEDVPPVLLVRVTPKLAEGFWTMIARGAARTQGVAIPPIKRFRSSFSRLRAFCGQAEVTPIHPFKIEHRLSDTTAIAEGLYAFDPEALGPHCGTVKLMLYSDKEPRKADTRVVDPAVIQQIWQDFAPYRNVSR